MISALSRALLGLLALLSAFGVARADGGYGPVNTPSRWTIQAADNHYCSAGTTYDSGSTVIFTGVGGEKPYLELRWYNRRWVFDETSPRSAAFILEFDKAQVQVGGKMIRDPAGLLFTFSGPQARDMVMGLPTFTRMILRSPDDQQAMLAGVQLPGMDEVNAELRKCWEQTGSYEYREQAVHREEAEGQAELEKRRADAEARQKDARDADDHRTACLARLRALKAEQEDALREGEALSRRGSALEAERTLIETRKQLAAKGMDNAAAVHAAIANFNTRMAAQGREAKANQARVDDINRRGHEANAACPAG